MTTQESWKTDPLNWGHGPAVFEAFLEPTCPFCARTFPKLFQLLQLAGEERLTVKVRLHSQPWHMYSGVICRAILAAATLPGGKEAAKKVMEAVFAHRDAFEFTHHASGPNMDCTPNDILKRIAHYSSVDVSAPFALPGLDREVKWHTRYARQNGIHVSPTFMVNGIVRAELGSGDELSKWQDALGLA
ncbi:MAG: thioredoxin domain-containing protein [Alphaproteobacteria bacterium]|nr:thioredoxin domain-containing protein [Alphaproteobacteria bacterium]